jgi:transcriptional regulator with XRE-family HTH domain
VDGVGDRLRSFRTARRLSQRDLGDRVGVTASFLSQLENGRTNASIATLRRLAEALGVRLSDLVEAGPIPTGRLLRHADRPQLSAAFGTTKWFITQPPLRHVEVYVAEMEPGGSTGPEQYQHGDSEEVVLVLRGSVVIELADQTYDLGAGDSIEYQSSTPHRVANHGDVIAELVWLNSPPTPE